MSAACEQDSGIEMASLNDIERRKAISLIRQHDPLLAEQVAEALGGGDPIASVLREALQEVREGNDRNIKLIVDAIDAQNKAIEAQGKRLDTLNTNGFWLAVIALIVQAALMGTSIAVNLPGGFGISTGAP
jgi:hypothetical protein